MNYKRNFIIKIIILAAVVCFSLPWLTACSGTINESINPESANNSITTDADSSITGKIELGFCKKVIALNNIAFALDSYYGLHILDLENINEPKIISSVRAPQPNDLFILGSTAYISDYIKGIIIMDIADYKNPVTAGLISSPNQTFSIYCTERFLFVTTQYTYYEKKFSNFIIYDISDKSNPEKISYLDQLPWINDVYIDKSYAYLAFDDSRDGTTGLIIIDISDIKNPALKGRLDTDGFATNLNVKEDIVFLADDQKGLKIIDIKDKEKPVLLGSLKLKNHTVDIALDGDYAYVADGYNGIKKISIKNMNAPEIIGGINTLGFARSLYVSGKYLYIADGKFLTISEKF